MFKVEGRSLEAENVTEVVNARKAKDIWNNPSNFGFSKIYKVTPISESRNRKQVREHKFN